MSSLSRGRIPTVALVLLATSLSLVAFATCARADVGEKIIDRCTHGESLKGFSQSAYRKALKELSAGTEEYSNCAALIRQAQLAGASGRTSAAEAAAGSTTAALPPTPAERQAIARAPSAGAVPLKVGGETIKPGVVHANIASAFSTLPMPLIATLAFLLLCLLLALGVGARDWIRERRRP